VGYKRWSPSSRIIDSLCTIRCIESGVSGVAGVWVRRDGVHPQIDLPLLFN
jgi:hypothetical protein